MLDLNNNSLTLSFKTDDSFDNDILITLEKKFKGLDQHKQLSVYINGFAPLEVLAYIIEVSKYCNMVIFIADEKGYEFLNHIKQEHIINVEIVETKLGEHNGK